MSDACPGPSPPGRWRTTCEWCWGVSSRVFSHLPRCSWCGDDPLYIQYHDSEWGVPLHDERALFELLVLEGAQAGLAWITILRKRDAFRRAFDGFDAHRIAGYDEDKVRQLLCDPGIVRNRRKIEAAIANARAFLAVQQEFGSFDSFIWSFVGGRPIQHHFTQLTELPSTSPEADAMSRALRQRGFQFVGPTICYAFMQAAGLVNDHLVSCFRHAQLSRDYA